MLSVIHNLLLPQLLVIALIGFGLWATLCSKYIQFRYFTRMFRILLPKYSEKPSGNHPSSFQALLLSIAGRVGTANISGVAAAIVIGGPGAIFWMWVVAMIGMATSVFECSLAQAYKRVAPDGTYRGGPAYYILYGLGKNWTWLAFVFSILLLVTFGFCFNSFQSYMITIALHNAFHIPIFVIALLLCLIIGIVIIGGIGRIIRVVDIVVPIMALGYIAMALLIVIINFQQLPAVFLFIIKSAFGFDAALGGGMGAALIAGVKRGLFSNEAGLGSVPNVAAVALVSHPVSQGIVQAFSVFIDTIVICSCTAFIILLSGVYQAGFDPNLTGTLVQTSLATYIGHWGVVFIAVMLFLFGLTTMIYNYYLGENCLIFMTNHSKLLLILYRFMVIAVCAISGHFDFTTVFIFADSTMGLLALVNLFALILLIKPALGLIRDYDDQVKKGVSEPVFDAATFAQAGIDQTIWDQKPKI